MTLKLIATLACLTVTMAQAADTIPPPLPVMEGDSWTYKKTIKNANNSQRSMVNYKITGKSGDKLIYQSLLSELSVVSPAKWRAGGELDSDTCIVDFGGGASLGLQKTCGMDLPQGMDWDTEETVKGVKTKRTFKVVGTETVNVKAGTFDTTKIEANWQITKLPGAVVKKGSAYGPTERYRFLYWYSPETKAMAKVVREFYTDAGAVESTVTEELDSYRPARAK